MSVLTELVDKEAKLFESVCTDSPCLPIHTCDAALKTGMQFGIGETSVGSCATLDGAQAHRDLCHIEPLRDWKGGWDCRGRRCTRDSVKHGAQRSCSCDTSSCSLSLLNSCMFHDAGVFCILIHCRSYLSLAAPLANRGLDRAWRNECDARFLWNCHIP